MSSFFGSHPPPPPLQHPDFPFDYQGLAREIQPWEYGFATTVKLQQGITSLSVFRNENSNIVPNGNGFKKSSCEGLVDLSINSLHCLFQFSYQFNTFSQILLHVLCFFTYLAMAITRLHKNHSIEHMDHSMKIQKGRIVYIL